MISVVMPTYNAFASFLKESVGSILDQSFRDFEFIIIDDCSTDETRDYLDSLLDPRVRVIRNDVHLGVTKSLNIGFREARGKYIARMDSDDISRSDRFEKQLAFMESHPDVLVCGSRVSYTREDTRVCRKKQEDMEGYRIRMLFSNPGPVHPTAFFRHESLLRHHIQYDENLMYAQDYGMWMTISQYGKIYTLPDKLLFYRKHGKQISKMHREEQIRCDKTTQEKLLCRLVDGVTEKELDIHYRYSTGYYRGLRLTKEVIAWYMKLIRANNRRGIYDRMRFRKAVCKILLRTFIRS